MRHSGIGPLLLGPGGRCVPSELICIALECWPAGIDWAENLAAQELPAGSVVLDQSGDDPPVDRNRLRDLKCFER